MINHFLKTVHHLFRGRRPATRSVLGTYAVIVFLVYSWTVFVSFYKLPSWLFYLSLYEIISIYAYSFLANLLESLVLLAGIFLLDYTVFLPLKNREEFQSRSILMVLAILACVMIRLILYGGYEESGAFVSGELTWWLLFLTGGCILAVLIPRIRIARTLVDALAERSMVFLYIYIPLSLLALAVVLARNFGVG